MIVRDVMMQKLVTVGPELSVSKGIETLLDEDVSSLLIVDGNERLVGLVTESVLLVAALDPQLRSDPISLHMERKFVSVGPDDPVGQVVEKFLLHRVRHFPVVKKHKLVGVVTRRELMRALLGQKVEV